MYESIDAVDIVKDNTLVNSKKIVLVAKLNKYMPITKIFKLCKDINIKTNQIPNAIKSLNLSLNEEVKNEVKSGKLKPIEYEAGKYDYALKQLSDYSKWVKGEFIILDDYLDRITAQAKDLSILTKIRVNKYLNGEDNQHVNSLEIGGIYDLSGELVGKEIVALIKRNGVLVNDADKLSIGDLQKTQQQFESEINIISSEVKELQKQLTPELIRDSDFELAEYELLRKDYEYSKEKYENFHNKYIIRKKGILAKINEKRYNEIDKVNYNFYSSRKNDYENYPKPATDKRVKLEGSINKLTARLDSLKNKKQLTAMIPARKKPDIIKLIMDYEKYYALLGCRTTRYDINIHETINNISNWLERNERKDITLKDFLKRRGFDESDIKNTFIPLYSKLKKEGIVSRYNKSNVGVNVNDKSLFEKYYGLGVCTLMEDAEKGLFLSDNTAEIKEQ